MKNPTRLLSPEEKKLFASVCQASRTINSTLEITHILESLLDTAISVTGAERGAVLFKEEPGPNLPEFRIGREMDAAALGHRDFEVSMTVIRKVLETQTPVITDNAPQDFQESRSVRLAGVRSILCVPLNTPPGDPLGVIYLDSRVSRAMFDGDDLLLVQALADQAGVALHNAFLYHLLEKSYMGAVRCLARTIGYKDRYTLEHSQRVSEHAKKIAEELGLRPEVAREVEISALLHDVGKIGVEEHVLKKPGKLTAEERQRVQEHPAMGYEILKDLELTENVMLGILHHQECFDGSGYPDGLAGEEIPLIARIISVADAWDAMTSDRAYRKALSIETALLEIKNNIRRQFDPIVVEAFLKVLEGEKTGSVPR